jgi:hypothetical protein
VCYQESLEAVIAGIWVCKDPATTRAGEHRGQTYPYCMSQNPEPRPRDDMDAAKDIARDLAEIASHIGQLKGDANAYLSDPNYDTLHHRLENALSLRWRQRPERI